MPGPGQKRQGGCTGGRAGHRHLPSYRSVSPCPRGARPPPSPFPSARCLPRFLPVSGPRWEHEALPPLPASSGTCLQSPGCKHFRPVRKPRHLEPRPGDTRRNKHSASRRLAQKWFWPRPSGRGRSYRRSSAEHGTCAPTSARACVLLPRISPRGSDPAAPAPLLRPGLSTSSLPQHHWLCPGTFPMRGAGSAPQQPHGKTPGELITVGCLVPGAIFGLHVIFQ